ncbi:MAG: hypothetical protein QF541_24900, partial [Lentisphaeria bacterium]|nr:hypothetical protein [Lentisphaeria bacterium]
RNGVICDQIGRPRIMSYQSTVAKNTPIVNLRQKVKKEIQLNGSGFLRLSILYVVLNGSRRKQGGRGAIYSFAVFYENHETDKTTVQYAFSSLREIAENHASRRSCP